MNKAFKWAGMIGLVVVGLIGGKYIFGGVDQTAPPPVPVYFSQDNTEITDGSSQIVPPMSGAVIDVRDGDSIQTAVNKAQPGDLIRVYPGTYVETVYIDKDSISLQGVIEEDRWPELDGEKRLNDAFLYSGNNILIENFKISRFKGNGIMGQAGNNFILRNNWIIDAGVYGIFPQYGTNGLIERNILTGIEDAAIYVGMCDNVDVRFNEVYGNVAGIEIENSRHALVEYNYAYNNSGGILVFITPGLPIKTTYDVIIRNNYVYDNNHENFGAPGSIVSMVPAGTGIIVMAGDDVIIENNIIKDNKNVGIVITDLDFMASVSVDPDSEPYPDRVVLLDNMMINNGTDPVTEVKALKLAHLMTGNLDIAAVGGGVDSCIRDRGRYSTIGLGGYKNCQVTDTKSVTSYMLKNPVPPRETNAENKSKLVYYGVCAGCHSYSTRMIGPPTMTLQALYMDNPQGIADYIANPVHKRKDYPEMPKQDYLSEELRLDVAKFMLQVKK